MVTGASTADLAIILVDCRNGIKLQTRRHFSIAYLLGIRDFVLAVNKMDKCGFSRDIFEEIDAEFRNYADRLGPYQLKSIPISALMGANVARLSKTPWYSGPSLIEWLNTVEPQSKKKTTEDFTMPVQWVNRTTSNFRGFAGLIASGQIKVGDSVKSVLTNYEARVVSIIGASGKIKSRSEGSITLKLDRDIDIGRGDLITGCHSKVEAADQFAAKIVWMDEKALLPGREYVIQFASAETTAKITDLSYKIDLNNFNQIAVKSLGINDVAHCKIALNQKVPFSPYNENRTLGSFILIDKLTNATAGAGMIEFSLRRADNLHWYPTKVTKKLRASKTTRSRVYFGSLAYRVQENPQSLTFWNKNFIKVDKAPIS